MLTGYAMPRPRDPDPSPDALRKRKERARKGDGLVSVTVRVPPGDVRQVEAYAERLRKIARK